MVVLARTTGSDPRLASLIDQLDDGDDDTSFVLALDADGVAVACGGIRPYDESIVELKRMFVAPDARGLGIARVVLDELEAWAREQRFRDVILETGARQTEAIEMYERSGYARIPAFPPYVGSRLSVCMRKPL